MGVKSLIEKGSIKVWKDVFDSRFDDKAAPDFGDVVRGEEKFFYSDPEQFFKRTYLTESMKNLIEDVAETLKAGKGGAIFLLTSLFGGGKTHTQICLYHAFNFPEKLMEVDRTLAAKVAEAGTPLIVAIDGSRSDLAPTPSTPFKTEGFTIRTIWGMLAYRLGAYAKVKHIDSPDSPAPQVDLIREMLSEAKGPVMILMDEIVHYVFNMCKSSELKDYGEKVVLFLEYLARAVESVPRTVLVVSIQGEYRVYEGERRFIEEGIFKDIPVRILRALSRESTRNIVPVSPDDVVKVLNKNIFETVSEEDAIKARDRIYEVYREMPDLFGVESDWQFSVEESKKTSSAKETYPFHPKYVEVLEEFVTRNRDLQKTRDAIRITRKVIRNLLRRDEDACFIMPWHIDLRDRDIRHRVLTESRREFVDVANRDIVSEEGRLGTIGSCSKPNLALKIATSILLKTYTYETFKEPLKVFPDLKAVALMVYEPETFSREGWEPVDIKNILEEMYGLLPHLDSEDGRYWFTPYPSVIEYVEKLAEEKLRGPRIELYRMLTESVKKVLSRGEGRRSLVAEQSEVFSEKNTLVVGVGDEVFGLPSVPDSPAIKLVVLVKPAVEEEDVRKIVLMAGGSGKRVYRNTVAVVCPSPKADFDGLLKYVAKIKAAKEVLDSIGEYYTDQDIRNLQISKLKKYIQNIESSLSQQILTTFTRIAYPFKRDVMDDIRWTDTIASSSLIAQVDAGLKDPGTGPKIKTDFTFSDLNTFLKNNLGWDLVEDSSVREMKDIVEVFYKTSSAPFTTRKAVENAIIEGLERLDIGVKVEGKLFWKRVGPDDGAEILQQIKDNAEILSYHNAAEELMKSLLSESGERKVGKQVHIISYAVEFAGKRMDLEHLARQEGWHKILKEGVILREERVIEKGFVLKLEPCILTLKPGDEAKTIVLVEPIEEYLEEVRLEAEAGSVEPTEGKPPLKAVWTVGVLDPGEYNFKVKAVSQDGTSSEAVLYARVESLEEDVTVNTLNLTHVGAKLLSISIPNILTAKMGLETVSKLNLKASASLKIEVSDNIMFSGKGLDVRLAGLFVQKFDDIFRALSTLAQEAKVDVLIKFEEPVVLDSQKITSLTILYGKATFKVRVKRYE